MAALAECVSRLRRGVRVRGTVQGVGFRPAVCRFADALALGGFVRNDAEGVLIEVEGEADAVARFLDGLPAAAPPIARIESVETSALEPLGESRFRIAPSGAPAARAPASSAASIPADLAPCADCLRELDDPDDRRFRYPFINCTNCGPRFTIVRALPYDRPRTTMARFDLCAACRREYEDPRDRRFHAEPNACPACGPVLAFSAPGGGRHLGEAALAAAARALCGGLVVAVKGAGGFLLAANAADDAAVARLRARKRRPAKPFAVMARSLDDLARIAILDEKSRAALLSPARPIVLVPARPEIPIAPGVAPGLRELGLFLPPTPLQHLLLGLSPPFLVMTSGNLAEEPIARDNAEAEARLAGVADAFLTHDRDIHTRADDSVTRIVAGEPRTLRRARGQVPEPIALPVPAPDAAGAVLAVGAELKTAVCLARGGEAILSQHLGDLHDADTFAFFEETVAKLGALAGAGPRAVAHDLHPDYRSTRWALGRGLPLEPVQHHHAHVASCLAEHGRTGPVLGVAFDGTGLGPDGTLWGGEILVADLGGFERVAHLRPLPLLGGEAAVREPWRLAAAALLDAGEPIDLLLDHVPLERVDAVAHLWTRPHLAPRATGAGRWFDAVAALCGLRAEVSYDGQAAVELEAAAASVADDRRYDLGFERRPDGPLVVDLRPAVRAIAAELRAGTEAPWIAARFHRTLARAAAEACRHARDRGAPETVALTGGCFQNRRLTELTKAELERLGFEVLLHRRVPCNDGGIALGQAAIACFRLAAAAAREGARSCA
jgi:hydrogenase maturation protein HypF